MCKMTAEYIIILILGVLCCVLAVNIIAKCAGITELENNALEQANQLEQLTSENAQIIAEKARLNARLDELAGETLKAYEIIDGYKAECTNLQDLLRRALEVMEPLAEEAEVIEAKSAPSGVNWSFDRLPEGLTNTYRCEDWRLFASGTEQELLQRDCLTDIETGIRFLERSGKQYLCAAMGSAYGITIGSGFEVELENGEVINVVLADFKHPINAARADDFGDADINYNGEATTCVLEFVYDKKIAPDIVIQRGGMFIDRFGGLTGEGGNLVRITYEGRVWEP